MLSVWRSKKAEAISASALVIEFRKPLVNKLQAFVAPTGFLVSRRFVGFAVIVIRRFEISGGFVRIGLIEE